jgi:hypothetical protein
LAIYENFINHFFDLNSESDTIPKRTDTKTMLRGNENGIDNSEKC